MITRPIFENTDVADLIEQIRTDDSIFSIRLSTNFGYLELRCNNPNHGTDFCFYMDKTEDLARGIGKEVLYQNGMILFTEPDNFNLIMPDSITYYGYDESDTEDDFNLLMPILETDYVVPMVEDIEECPVCYESYEPMYGSLCGHHTCNECMISMAAKGLTKCPMCRSADFKFPIALACNRSFVKV